MGGVEEMSRPMGKEESRLESVDGTDIFCLVKVGQLWYMPRSRGLDGPF